MDSAHFLQAMSITVLEGWVVGVGECDVLGTFYWKQGCQTLADRLGIDTCRCWKMLRCSVFFSG